MYIPQYLLKKVQEYLVANKALLIYGPRRCGKTTLLTHLSKIAKEPFLMVNGDDVTVQEYLSSQSLEKLRSFVGSNKLVIIDEAQRIKNIGFGIKLLLDNLDGIKVVASGSSAFELAKAAGEPLTGRKYTFHMYPLSQIELSNIQTRHQTDALLEDRLIYGSYPEVVLIQDNSRRQVYLRELISSYLYKDILELDGVRHSDKLSRLLQCLAFQIGKEVSFNELGTQLGMSKNTVERYLDLLEKSFVVFRLNGFSRNLRKEIAKNSRYYFYDIGVRNAIINNFNSLSLRNDVGMIWENYVIAEMLKKQEYFQLPANNYFWRTYDHKEIDLVSDRDGKLYAYEIKWTVSKKQPPKDWTENYPESEYNVISKNNYLEFIV